MDEPKIVEVTGTIDKHFPLPVMPLYDLKLAAQLIPCKYKSLIEHLRRFKAEHPAVYRRFGTGQRVRLLSAYEIRTVRQRMLKGPGLERVLELYPTF